MTERVIFCFLSPVIIRLNKIPVRVFVIGWFISRIKPHKETIPKTGFQIQLN